MRKFTVTKAPFLNHWNSTHKMKSHFLLSLCPLIFYYLYQNGIAPYLAKTISFSKMLFPFFLLIISIFSCYVGEGLFRYVIYHQKGYELKQTLKKSDCIFSGILLILILPIQTPIFLLVIACFTAVIIKMITGGRINPTYVGFLFIVVFYSLTMKSTEGLDLDIQNKIFPVFSSLKSLGNYETLIAPYGNLLSFFWGILSSKVGTTCVFLCILSFLYLILTHVIKWKIPIFYIGTVFFVTFLIGKSQHFGIWYPIFQILCGGIFFGAIFMASDPISSPVTSIGQILYAISLGLATVFFRYLTPYSGGVLPSVLLMNFLVPFFDRIGSSSKIAIKKIGIPLITLFTMAIMMISYITAIY